MNLGPTVNTASGDASRRFRETATGCSSPATVPAGSAGNDIWASWRPQTHDDFGWQAPVNLGAGREHRVDRQRRRLLRERRRRGARSSSSRAIGRAASAGTDLYMSELQADGSWGPATPIAELNSTANDNRPSIRHDGLEIFFYSSRAGGVGRNRPLGRNARHGRRTLVDAGQPRRDREHQRRRHSALSVRGRGDALLQFRAARAVSAATTCI